MWSCKQFATHPKRHSPSPTALYQYELSQAHSLLYMSVLDTRTASNCRCSFNWKRRTDENCELSIITSAIDTCELWVLRPGRFIPSETGQYILTTRLCGPQSQSGNFGEDRKHSLLPEFEPWDRPAKSLVRRRTAPILFKISQVEKVSNLLTNGCCDHSCSVVYPYLTVLCVIYFISSCEDVSKESIGDYVRK
jgi:hypothetical protein